MSASLLLKIKRAAARRDRYRSATTEVKKLIREAKDLHSTAEVAEAAGLAEQTVRNLWN